MTSAAPSSTGAEADDRATPLRVVGLLVGLALIVGAAARLLQPRGAELVAEEALAGLFAAVAGDHDAGFESVEARELPAGETLVRFTGGESPVEFLLVRYPRSRAEGVLEDQFRSLEFEDGGDRGGFGGEPGEPGDDPELQDAGVLDWHGLEARYARLRHAEPSEGDASEADDAAGDETGAAATYDTIRVNLTTGQQCLVAYARFAPGAEATTAAVERILHRFLPRE